MSRMSRTLRRAIAPAAVILGLLAVPGSALAAAPAATFMPAAGSPAAGATRQYDVSLTGTAALAGTIHFSLLSGDMLSVASASAATGADAVKIDCANVATTNSCDILPSFGSDAAFSISVKLPKSYTSASQFKVQATFTGDAAEWGAVAAQVDTAGYEVKKGGTSNIVTTIGATSSTTPTTGLADKWVAKGGELNTTLNVTNYGAGVANFVTVGTYVNKSANEFSPEPPAYNPTVVFVPGATCTLLAPDFCEIASIAPGATVSIPVKVTGLTHYGTIQVAGYFSEKADNGADGFFEAADGTQYNNMNGKTLAVTDGTTVEPHVAVRSAVRSAAGNANVTWNGELTNNGPQAITNGVLHVNTQSFTAAGDSAGTSQFTDAAGIAASTQSITLSNGAACVRAVDPSSGKTYFDRYNCPIASLAAGARITVVVVTKYATSKKDQYGSVNLTLASTSYSAPGSMASRTDYVELNLAKFVDIEVTVSSSALVGADRATPVTLVVANKGNSKAEGVSVNGDIWGTAGTFDSDLLPTSCTGVTRPQHALCGLGEIEAGASKTLVLNVKAGAKLGLLASTYSAYSDNLFDTNDDNNTVTQAMTIVKANAVPLLGVFVAKAPAQAMAKVAKTGVKTVVTVPGPATVKVDLIVTAKVAQGLGLVKAPKKSMKKAKKAPAFYTIGTSTTKVAAAGQVTTTTKLSKKYAKKLLAAKKKFAVKRTITVVSTAPKTAGASSMTSQTLTFTPAKKKAKK